MGTQPRPVAVPDLPDLRRAQGRGLAALSTQLRPREILRGVVEIFRARPARVIGTAALVFGTVAWVQAVVEIEVVERHLGIELDLAAQILSTVITAFGFVFYAGLLDLVVGAYRDGEPDPTLREVIERLPHGRLVAADAILVVGVGALALAFVVPGIVAMTFFCLVGPIIVRERLGVFGAFRRSAQLVRPHFWLVLVMVVIPIIIEDQVIHGIDLTAFDRRLVGAFCVSALLGAALGSVVGLLEVVLAHELREQSPLPRSDAA